MNRTDLNSLLGKACRQDGFGDGERDRIWAQAHARLGKKGTPLRWAIPLAAALTALITLFSMPQARAAMATMLGGALNIFGYLGMDRDSRPKNSAVAEMVQGNIPADVAVSAEPGNEWVKRLGFRIDEVLYDGIRVYIRYTVDPKGRDYFKFAVPDPAQGRDVKYEAFMPLGFELDGGVPLQMESCWPRPGSEKKWSDPWYDVVQLRATGAKLKGVVTGTLTVGLYDTTETVEKGETVGYQQRAGTITARFSFDASAALKNAKTLDLSGERHALSGDAVVTEQKRTDSTLTFENREISLNGCALAADTVSIRPTGIDVMLHFIASEGLPELDIHSSIDAKLLDGAAVVGRTDEIEPDGDNGAYLYLSVPLEYVDGLDRLTVRFTVFHQPSVKDHLLELNKPFEMPLIQGDFYSIEHDGGDPVAGGTFDIDLTKAE